MSTRAGRTIRQAMQQDLVMEHRYGKRLAAYRQARTAFGRRLGDEAAQRIGAGEDPSKVLEWMEEQRRTGEAILDAWARWG